jgi:hypothetical protein
LVLGINTDCVADNVLLRAPGNTRVSLLSASLRTDKLHHTAHLVSGTVGPHFNIPIAGLWSRSR